MNTIGTSEATDALIDTAEEMARLADTVRGADWVAIDTEADSLYSYPERLCLLQISVPGADALVDTLAGLDLAALREAMSLHTIILHGGDYDLRLLSRSLGLVPRGVFDTMLAARLLGLREFGLEKLLGQLLGVALEKGPQRADWSRRPLTRRMIDYARNDARHLKPLADCLARDLEGRGRAGWHAEMCRRLVRECTREPEVDGDRVWRLSGAHRLGRRGLAVLREVWHWRDREARRLRRPPYFVLPHETVVAIAEAAVGPAAGVDGVLPRRMSPARRAGVVAAVTAALALPESRWPHPLRAAGLRLTTAQRRAQVRLQERRDRAAHQLQIDPSLIASRALLVRLAGGQVDPDRELMAWQRELLLHDEPAA